MDNPDDVAAKDFLVLAARLAGVTIDDPTAVRLIPLLRRSVNEGTLLGAFNAQGIEPGAITRWLEMGHAEH